MKYRYLPSVIACLVAVLVAVVSRAEDPAAAGRAGGLLPAAFEKVDLAEVTPERLVRDWPAFTHAALDPGGFNAVMLPMQYEDAGAIGNDDEANAFSFLLSSDLDWSSASYNARHAYFVFKREPQMAALRRGYDAATIKAVIDSWTATHAVGGTITKTEDGYSGTLQIFGRDGKVAKTEAFETPRDYFDLLGDMSVAALTDLGPAPTPALVKHLHERRAKMSSVVLLGQAAFAEEDSPREFGLYDKILGQDPDFGQVRAWVALRRGWNGAKGEAEQDLIALKAFPMVETARTIQEADLTPEHRAELPAIRDTVRDLAGADNSKYLEWMMTYKAADHSRPTTDEIAAAERVASVYPNQFWLEREMVWRLSVDKAFGAHPDYIASAALTGVLNRYLPGGSGSRFYLCERFAELASESGLPTESAAMFETQAADLSAAGYTTLLQYLTLAGLYDEEVATFQKVESQLSSYPGVAEIYTAYSMAMSGKVDALGDLLNDRRPQLEKAKAVPLVQAYLALLNNQPVDAAAVDAAAKNGAVAAHLFYVVLRAQIDLKAGRSDRFYDVLWESASLPGCRPLWYMLDEYDRKAHREQLNDFYRTLAFLYPDDPQATALVKGWKDRTAGMTLAPVETKKVEAFLADYPARVWVPADKRATAAQLKAAGKYICWSAAAAAGAEAEAGHPDVARDIALRFAFLGGRVSRDELIGWCDHLYFHFGGEAGPTTRPAN